MTWKEIRCATERERKTDQISWGIVPYSANIRKDKSEGETIKNKDTYITSNLDRCINVKGDLKRRRSISWAWSTNSCDFSMYKLIHTTFRRQGRNVWSLLKIWDNQKDYACLFFYFKLEWTITFASKKNLLISFSKSNWIGRRKSHDPNYPKLRWYVTQILYMNPIATTGKHYKTQVWI